MALAPTVCRTSPAEYFQQSGVDKRISIALNECYSVQPPNPVKFVTEHLRHNMKAGAVSAVSCVPRLDAGQIGLGIVVETAGGETSEVLLRLPHSAVAVHPNPVRETIHSSLRLHEKNREEQCASLAARLSSALTGSALADQTAADAKVQQEDGTENYATLGSNVTSALSLAVVIASSKCFSKPAFFSLLAMANNSTTASTPLPIVTLFGCGDPKHFGRTRILEVCVLPASSVTSTREASFMLSRVAEEANKKIGDDCPLNGDGSLKFTQYDNLTTAVDVAEEAIKEAGYTAGTDCFIGVIIDAAWCFKEGQKYAIADSLPDLSGAQLAELLATLCRDKKSVAYLEDTHQATDVQEMRRLMSRIGSSVSIAGLNTFGGNAVAAANGVQQLQVNTVGAKLEDCGSISNLVNLYRRASAPGVVRSYVSGSLAAAENADVAVGVGARYIRVGGLHRGAGSAIINRLSDIDDWLSKHGMKRPLPSDAHASCVLPPAPAEPVVDVQAKDAKKKK